jgi:tetratricopeptide (TPR) repeat protein
LKKDPTVGRVVELSINCHAAAGDWDRAAREAGELVRLYPEEPMPHVFMAQVELARERAPAAREYAERALDLDPFCVPAIMTRALLYAQAGDFESARVSYEKLFLFDDVNLTSVGHEGIAFADFLAGDFDDGVDAMDEAIRHAMMAGAHRRGLALSTRLVEYLCQLGRADAAEGVVERWVTEFGDVPVRLARARIQLLRGDIDAGNDVLAHLTSEKEWVLWSRTLSLDTTELMALSELAQDRPRDAMTGLLRDEKERAAVNVSAAQRRAFLVGYAAFQAGDAEAAVTSFTGARRGLYGLEFPYHGDPVLYVQSLFYRAESQLAAGQQPAAKESYAAFIAYWGEAAWGLDAVARARQKLEALGGAVAPPQG